MSVGMAPAGSKVSLDPAMFMLQNKRFIGCTEGGSITNEVWVHRYGYRSTTDFSIVYTTVDRDATTWRLPNREALHVLFVQRY